jgi:hypothetical protein
MTTYASVVTRDYFEGKQNRNKNLRISLRGIMKSSINIINGKK